MKVNKIELNRLLIKKQLLFNSMECPDCGGVHHCRLHLTSDGEVRATFFKGLVIKPCWGYMNTVNNFVNEINEQIK